MTPEDFLKSHESEVIQSDNKVLESSIETTTPQDGINQVDEKLEREISLDNKTLDRIQYLKEEAIHYKEKQNLEEAEKKLIEASTLNPNDFSVQKFLNDIYFEQGKYIKSATLLKKLLLEEADNHKFLWQL
jgi:tetratricopeptide (TPR) repeat protein